MDTRRSREEEILARSRTIGAGEDAFAKGAAESAAATRARTAELAARIVELQGAIRGRGSSIASLRAYLTATSGRARDDDRIDVLLSWIREIESQLGREKRAPATRHDLTAGSESRVLSASPPTKEADPA